MQQATTLVVIQNSIVLFDYLRCMLILIIAVIQLANDYLPTLPLLQRLRLQRGCKLLSAMGSPPALTLRDYSRCEFVGGKVKCLHASITETPCCASGRCSKHSDKNYGCGCWLTQAIRASQRKCGRPEVSVSKVEAGKCEDCQSGMSCLQHMGICQKTAFTACVLCSKYKCHERQCIDKICCDESYACMMLAKKSCEKEVLTESKLSPLALSSSLMPAAYYR